MPLRDLFYIVREYKKMLDKKSLYFSSRVKMPAPHFVVFYNGIEQQPENRILKLSDLYSLQETEPELELKVQAASITPGNNQNLLAQCKVLKEYILYV